MGGQHLPDTDLCSLLGWSTRPPAPVPRCETHPNSCLPSSLVQPRCPSLPYSASAPKAQFRYYESWSNCQEMEVSFGISFILISPPQMVKLRSVKKLARSKTSYHAGVTNCDWLSTWSMSAQRHLQTQGMQTQAHRCTHRHRHTERHAEDYWKCHQLRNVLKVTFLSLYKTGVLQLHQPNYFSSNRDECH